MDAQDTMRLMFDTMDAYDRGDFDRLGEVYAEDAVWMNSDPSGPHCNNREDIFDMFRGRKGSDVKITFDEIRSTPTQVLLAVRAADFDRAFSVFTFEGRQIVRVDDYNSIEVAEAEMLSPSKG